MEEIPPVKDVILPVKDVPIAMGHVEDIDMKGATVTDQQWTDDGFLRGIVMEHKGKKYTLMTADDSPSQMLELFLHTE